MCLTQFMPIHTHKTLLEIQYHNPAIFTVCRKLYSRKPTTHLELMYSSIPRTLFSTIMPFTTFCIGHTTGQMKQPKMSEYRTARIHIFSWTNSSFIDTPIKTHLYFPKSTINTLTAWWQATKDAATYSSFLSHPTMAKPQIKTDQKTKTSHTTDISQSSHAWPKWRAASWCPLNKGYCPQNNLLPQQRAKTAAPILTWFVFSFDTFWHTACLQKHLVAQILQENVTESGKKSEEKLVPMTQPCNFQALISLHLRYPVVWDVYKNMHGKITNQQANKYRKLVFS